MNLTYVKKVALFIALIFLFQGCALYVRDDDRHWHHHYHHGYDGWR